MLNVSIALSVLVHSNVCYLTCETTRPLRNVKASIGNFLCWYRYTNRATLLRVGRRRKVRCTYQSDRPQICNECHLRGSTCIDQEHAPEPSPARVLSGEQNYSLRERVTQLENVVRSLLQNSSQITPQTSPTPEDTYELSMTQQPCVLRKPQLTSY